MPPRDLTTLPLTLEELANITRRRILTAMPALAALGAGLSCGDDDDDDATNTPATGGFPRTVKHLQGDTAIPTQPSRIATLGDFQDLDYVLALGLKPVAYGFTNAWGSGLMPWQAGLDGVQQLDAEAELDLEQLAAAKPDLIIGVEWAGQEAYDQLSAIAPVILVPTTGVWREDQRLVGQATGLDGKAEEAIAKADAEIASHRAKLQGLDGRTIMIASSYGDTFYIQGPDSPAGAALTELGLTFRGGADSVMQAASLEEMNLVKDAEILISFTSDPEAIAAQEASPLFRSLPAVQRGGYDTLTRQQGRAIADSYNACSIPWLLPQLSDILTRLAAGQGKKLA